MPIQKNYVRKKPSAWEQVLGSRLFQKIKRQKVLVWIQNKCLATRNLLSIWFKECKNIKGNVNIVKGIIRNK